MFPDTSNHRTFWLSHPLKDVALYRALRSESFGRREFGYDGRMTSWYGQSHPSGLYLRRISLSERPLFCPFTRTTTKRPLVPGGQTCSVQFAREPCM